MFSLPILPDTGDLIGLYDKIHRNPTGNTQGFVLFLLLPVDFVLKETTGSYGSFTSSTQLPTYQLLTRKASCRGLTFLRSQPNLDWARNEDISDTSAATSV